MPVDKRLFNPGRILAGGGALAVLGSFQTWITAKASSSDATIQTIVVKGTSAGHSGNSTLIIGVAIMAIGALRMLRAKLPRWPLVTAAGLAVVTILATVADYVDLGNRTVKGFRYTYSAGIGLFIEIPAGAWLALRPSPIREITLPSA